MKLIAFLYLEDDAAVVARLLKKHHIVAYSKVELEGHGEGGRGWYGDVAPYASAMVFTLVPAETAQSLLAAVRDATGLADPRHPIHAMQLSVEAMAESGQDAPS